MASHVVVIDSAARRTMIKTTPNKHLSEVLEEAGSKLGINASQYGLKHNNKPVDLSRTIRLSGLSSGAKLELVQLSKSAGVVSIALQLPQSEGGGRLTDKFPSSTTLWLVLRKFEAGVAGGPPSPKNFTARGAPSANSGAGRLYYEQPVLQVMNRELSTFTDLQKSLAQLGLNSGTGLLRLNFRATETPLEEAMSQIQGYFDSVEGAAPPQQQSQENTPSTASNAPVPPSAEVAESSAAAAQNSATQQPPLPQGESQTEAEVPTPTSPQPESIITSATSRPVSVYRPPSSSTPSAALMTHNEADYTPTVEHAQIHQKLLQQNSRNTRLPTEAELATQANEEAARWAAVQEVEIKIRFPDQSAASAKFGQADTGAGLYAFVRECMEDKWRTEPFVLRNPGIRGKNEIIPDTPDKKLIKDLQLKGRVLVVFGWDDLKASVQARSVKSVLKEELQVRAQELKVADISAMSKADDNDPGLKVNLGKETASASAEDGGEGKKKLPKWLKGLSRK